MTPTELWDIYYHAMKEWLPNCTDIEVREAVSTLMFASEDFAIKYINK